jgi:hypothetical protein
MKVTATLEAVPENRAVNESDWPTKVASWLWGPPLTRSQAHLEGSDHADPDVPGDGSSSASSLSWRLLVAVIGGGYALRAVTDSVR